MMQKVEFISALEKYRKQKYDTQNTQFVHKWEMTKKGCKLIPE